MSISKIRSTLSDEGLGGVVRKVGRRLLRVFEPKKPVDPIPVDPILLSPHVREYAEWRARFDTLTQVDTELIAQHIQAAGLPGITVLLRLREVAAAERDATLCSLQDQLFENWRAVVVLDSVADLPAQVLGDSRFSVLPDTAADEQLAVAAGDPGAPWVLIDSPLKLRPHALYLLALQALQGAALVYADSDRMLIDGTLFEPYFKPRYSPELLRHVNYIGGCALFGLSSAVDPLGYLRGEGSVRALFAAIASQVGGERVVHVPQVLFHEMRDTREPDLECEPAALAEQELPMASLIICTRNSAGRPQACLESIVAKTVYPPERLQVVVMEGPGSDSRLANSVAQSASGDLLVFLSDDIEVDDPMWLQRMAAYAMQPDVGAVGGKLLYPDRRVRHGGIVLGAQGVAASAHQHLPENEYGHQYLNVVDREVSAVSGACLAIRKAVFDQHGGFDEHLALNLNAVVLCLDALARGYRNIYVASPLLIHHEATAGDGGHPEQADTFLAEARHARSKHPGFLARDPYYSPNLCLQQLHVMADPPRVTRPWVAFGRERSPRLRILMLGWSHQIGHGVPVVMSEQARYLASLGHEVFIGGGPRQENEFAYEGCTRVELIEPQEAARFAINQAVDCVVAHTPPYFSVFRWLGDACATLVYDYGEPDPDFFPDAPARRATLVEKRLCLPMANRLYAISRSVCDESGEPGMQAIRIANSHLTVWEPAYAQRRSASREAMQWQGKVVVMNVCRFHESERLYKGINAYVELLQEFRQRYPALSERVVFLLCGKGSEQDQAEMEAQGLTILANAPDDRLIDMYAAADVYVNLSRWEGYNLGIGQALAMGLPVLASDIPAHREFGVPVSNDSGMLADELKALCDAALAMGEGAGQRQPTVWYWNTPLQAFAEAIDEAVASWRATHYEQVSAGGEPGLSQERVNNEH